MAKSKRSRSSSRRKGKSSKSSSSHSRAPFFVLSSAVLLFVVLGLYAGHGTIIGSFVSGSENETLKSKTNINSLKYSFFNDQWRAEGIVVLSKQNPEKKILSIDSLLLTTAKSDGEQEEICDCKYEEITARGVKFFANTESIASFSALRKLMESDQPVTSSDFSTKRATIHMDSIYVEIPIPNIGSREFKPRKSILKLEGPIDSKEALVFSILEQIVSSGDILPNILYNI